MTESGRDLMLTELNACRCGYSHSAGPERIGYETNKSSGAMPLDSGSIKLVTNLAPSQYSRRTPRVVVRIR